MLVEVKIITAPGPAILTAPDTQDWVGCCLSAEADDNDDFYITSARRVISALLRLGRKEAALVCAAHFARKELTEIQAIAEEESWEMAFFVCGYYTVDKKIFLKKDACEFLFARTTTK